jgi:hypothetical protein
MLPSEHLKLESLYRPSEIGTRTGGRWFGHLDRDLSLIMHPYDFCAVDCSGEPDTLLQMAPWLS